MSTESVDRPASFCFARPSASRGGGFATRTPAAEGRSFGWTGLEGGFATRTPAAEGWSFGWTGLEGGFATTFLGRTPAQGLTVSSLRFVRSSNSVVGVFPRCF